MKKRIFCIFTLALMLGVCGCGNKKEAVITGDGEDITIAEQQYETLSPSVAKVFSNSDLTASGVEYLASEEQVKSKLGSPKEITDIKDNDNSGSVSVERVYKYDERTLTFTLINGEYKLTAFESRNSSDTFSRGLNVGDTFDDLIKVYYRDMNCMNNTFYSADKSAALGKFLYGNYTMDNFEAVKPSENVEYGIINYNGYDSLESAESYIVEMFSFTTPYKTGVATTSDDFAAITVEFDKDNKITSINWYYYPEED